MSLVICEQRETMIVTAARDGDDLWTSGADLARATGWELKPEGLCKAEVCVPLSPERRRGLVRGEAGSGPINLTGLWRSLGHPVVRDAAGDTWVLGTSAGARGQTLETLDAPDFALPDLDGRTHTLSQLRGKKVFLATWASW